MSLYCDVKQENNWTNHHAERNYVAYYFLLEVAVIKGHHAFCRVQLLHSFKIDVSNNMFASVMSLMIFFFDKVCVLLANLSLAPFPDWW